MTENKPAFSLLRGLGPPEDNDTLSWKTLITAVRWLDMHAVRGAVFPHGTAWLSMSRVLWAKLRTHATPIESVVGPYFLGLRVDTNEYLPPNMIACRDHMGKIIGVVLLTDSAQEAGT